ncbi:hypothetical protein V6N11_082698 [Hibiscus sabdariffa]|uniref:Uncharacterized protein n=1 Tax=Hibiscus sabdariffa TaxID=183260 RepID=A0ABR2A8N3_9ROSI
MWLSDCVHRRTLPLGESIDDFNDDEETIVPIMEEGDVHLLDVDDIETVIIDETEGNSLDVEDDAWSAPFTRLGLGNDKPDWGYVGPETEQPVPNYPTYELPARIYDADYIAM